MLFAPERDHTPLLFKPLCDADHLLTAFHQPDPDDARRFNGGKRSETAQAQEKRCLLNRHTPKQRFNHLPLGERNIPEELERDVHVLCLDPLHIRTGIGQLLLDPSEKCSDRLRQGNPKKCAHHRRWNDAATYRLTAPFNTARCLQKKLAPEITVRIIVTHREPRITHRVPVRASLGSAACPQSS